MPLDMISGLQFSFRNLRCCFTTASRLKMLAVSWDNNRSICQKQQCNVVASNLVVFTVLLKKSCTVLIWLYCRLMNFSKSGHLCKCTPHNTLTNFYNLQTEKWKHSTNSDDRIQLSKTHSKICTNIDKHAEIHHSHQPLNRPPQATFSYKICQVGYTAPSKIQWIILNIYKYSELPHFDNYY